MKKTFKLNNWQDITIEDSHILYSEILLAVLGNQDIYDIVKHNLIKQYKLKEIKFYNNTGFHKIKLWITSRDVSNTGKLQCYEKNLQIK